MKYFVLILFILSSFLVMTQVSTPHINVNGKATVYATPDEALISFSVITTDNDILAAKEKNSSISVKTINFLKQSGVKEEHIQTQYLNIGLNYKHNRNPNQEDKFLATQTFSVCVTDLDNLENIFSGLLTREVANLGNPVFRTTQLEELENEAKIKALKKAKSNAELMASTLDSSIGSVFSISENTPGGGQFRMAYAETMKSGSADGGSDSFAAGQLEITATVQVTFLLTL